MGAVSEQSRRVRPAGIIASRRLAPAGEAAMREFASAGKTALRPVGAAGSASPRWAAAALVAAIVALVAVGCGPQTAQFTLNDEGRDPASITPLKRDTIVRAMAALFGTPDQPAAPPEAELDTALLAIAAGPVGSDESGRMWGLYRKYCASCHGISGDGAGPSAAALSPYPRDFRWGLFKYTSTAGGAKPAADDLNRTLQRGIPGTAMPSFAKLSAEHRAALVEYVRYLSIRGETERELISLVVDQDELMIRTEDLAADSVEPLAGRWRDAAHRVVAAPEFLSPVDTRWNEAARRGQQLYASPAAQCAKCHGPHGRGDGEQAADLYDDWNKPKKGITPEQTRQLASRFRLPLQAIRPRDLAREPLHGGAAPIDLYWRVAVGIKGTPMPAALGADGKSGALRPDEIRDLVCYIQSLSPHARRAAETLVGEASHHAQTAR